MPDDPYQHPIVAALMDYTTGQTDGLREPWFFGKDDSACYLKHEFPRGGFVQFLFRFAKPAFFDQPQWKDSQRLSIVAAREQGLENSPAFLPGYLRLRVDFAPTQDVAENTGRVVLGDKVWATRRAKLEPPHPGRSDIIEGDQAREILFVLQDAESIVLSWRFHNFSDRSQTRFPQFPAASSESPVDRPNRPLQKFIDCVSDYGKTASANP
ncbi:MAG: hypothetical protein AAFM91_07480 [Pseudomonadota bacterium]